MPHPVIIAFGAFLVLAACLPPDPPATTLPAEDACGATALQSRVGAPVRDQDFTGQGATQRIMAEGSPMTMDYRADRLNVTYDARGRITRIWCG
jgi:hypothetical protein